MLKFTAALLVSLTASQARAAGAEIVACDGLESVDAIAGELQNSTRTFARGKIRLWHIDTGGEPVCCSSHLVIVAPTPDEELGGLQCKRLSSQGSLGFQWLNLPAIKSSYHAGKGLLISVPVEYYNDGNAGIKRTINVRINQATGGIIVE